jgi:hypothetical protein
MKLEIQENACGLARKLIADGLDPSETLEFYRGDMLCLRGKAGDFARVRVTAGAAGTPVLHRRRRALGAHAAAGRSVLRRYRRQMEDTMAGMSLKRIRAAREELVKRGVLVDSDKRVLNPKTGKWEIAWMLNPELSEEQQKALVEKPDIAQ